MAEQNSLLLGQLLINKQIITPQQLETALREHKKNRQFLGTTLINLGFASEYQVFTTLSEQSGIPYVKIKELKIDNSLIEKIPAKFACHYRLFPVKIKDKKLTVALVDPFDIHTLDDLKLLLGYDIEPVLSSEKDILDAIKNTYGIGAANIDNMIAETEKMGREEEENSTEYAINYEDVENLAQDASVVNFVNNILMEAVKDGVTDIHLEPFEGELRLRYRIDGVLHNVPIPAGIERFQSAIVSRIKIMANLNITEKRLPQDGRIKIRVQQEELDLRISILPTPYGESVNIRILAGNMLLDLKGLGLLPDDLKILESMIDKPHGIIFVTGPTGSGKTTTLYACLSKINNDDRKIITIEDPIEYQLHGISQIHVKPDIGLTFANGLRSVLRHDPDIMMVGEVRDVETAQITIRVALTGHLVFSTLHTNDAAGGITRLIDMNVEPYLIASSVECFIAQRLVRIICNNCKRKTKISAFDLDISKIKVVGINADSEVYYGAGCETCRFTGYKNRTAIYEFMVINDAIRELILKKASANQIKKQAIANGMRTLYQDGWSKIKKGITTIEEVLRVTQEETLK